MRDTFAYRFTGLYETAERRYARRTQPRRIGRGTFKHPLREESEPPWISFSPRMYS